jgi:hypothetical protein
VSTEQTPPTCLLCHWESDEEEGTNLPDVIHPSGVYVCKECNTRCKTVDSFGLTVEELKKAAIAYKINLSLTHQPVVRFESDPNNGAGLWAVFIGSTPIHHFPKENTPTAYIEKVYAAIREAFDERHQKIS